VARRLVACGAEERFDCLQAEANPSLPAQLANELSTSIKDAVKALGLPRYKLVVHVTLGQQAGQGMRVASRGLWDAATDSFVSETYENASLFACAQVYGIYVN
jgi:tctex1 domain-containing protein 2